MKTSKSIADEILRGKAQEEIEDEKADEKIKAMVEKKLAEKEAELKAEKEAEKSSGFSGPFTTKPIPPLEEYGVKPVFNPHSKEGRAQDRKAEETRGRKPLPRIVCPFCENEKKQNGVKLHVEDAHGVPGVSVRDLVAVQDGVKSLEDLVYEKFGDGAEINLRNLSDRVSEEEFGSWDDGGSEVEDVDLKAEDNPGDVDLKAEDNPGREVERRRLNLMPPFSPFERRRSRIL